MQQNEYLQVNWNMLFNFCALNFIFLSYAKLISREQTLIKGKQDNQGELSKDGPRETTTMQNLSI